MPHSPNLGVSKLTAIESPTKTLRSTAETVKQSATTSPRKSERLAAKARHNNTPSSVSGNSIRPFAEGGEKELKRVVKEMTKAAKRKAQD